MATLLTKSVYCSKMARVVLLGLMALSGAARPLFGQEMVAGKFKLTETARLGKKLLPAGAYTFSIEPAGTLQSVSSIQGARQAVVVVVRPETKAGPIAAIFAMASRSGQSRDASKLVLEPGNDGMAVRSMYLDQQGLVLDFDWSSSKDRTPMLAQAVRPETGSASKATD